MVAAPGIVAGVLLSVARVIGETAPVLVLVGNSRSINMDIFHGNMASLPLLIFTELTNPERAGFQRAWGAALTLIIIVAVTYLAAAAVRFLTKTPIPSARLQPMSTSTNRKQRQDSPHEGHGDHRGWRLLHCHTPAVVPVEEI